MKYEIKQFKKQVLSSLLVSVILICNYCSHPKVFIPLGTELGKEYLNSNEEEIAKRTLELTLNSIKIKSDNGSKVLRDAHPKHHGYVSGSFSIENTIPTTMKFGIFSEPKSYSIWIRFTNGGTPPKDDKEGDIRGMSIKLIGVDGEKLLDDEKNEKTQDFFSLATRFWQSGIRNII